MKKNNQIIDVEKRISELTALRATASLKQLREIDRFIMAYMTVLEDLKKGVANEKEK